MLKNPLTLFSGYLNRLKSPQLVMLLGSLFVIDLFFMDPLPFVDEAILLVLTLLAARWKKSPAPEATPKPPPKNVTPADGR